MLGVIAGDAIGAGTSAQAKWGVPETIRAETLARLDPQLRGVVAAFEARYGTA